MITNEFVKTTFIHTIVSRDINRIYQTQEDVIRQNFPNNTRSLANFLSSRPFYLTSFGMNKMYRMSIFSYLRFLDIKYSGRSQMDIRRKLAIYNRVVWGVLYNETLQDLRYGFTNQVQKYIRETLDKNKEISTSEINSLMNH